MKRTPFIFILLSCFGAALSSWAATRTVSNFDDGGPGTLRDAIAASASGDTINFLPGLGVVTITLTNELVIALDLTIIGNGANNLVIEGGAARVFNISRGTVNISGLTITNGNAG